VSTDWQDIRWLLEVVQRGSFSAAARAQGTSQATVSRRIKALEQALGTDLFVRGRIDTTPTEAAQQLTRAAQPMTAGYAAFQETLATIKGQGRKVVVTCGALLGRHLSRHTERLYEGLTSVEIEIRATSAFLDLEAGQADLALRNQRPQRGRLRAHRVQAPGYGRFSVFGSARHFAPDQFHAVHELARAPWLSLTQGQSQLPTARWVASHVGADAVVFRMANTQLLLEAVPENKALALLPHFIGAQTPGLVKVFGPVEELNFELWMVRRESSADDAVISCIMANVEKLFAQTTAV